MKNPQRDLYKKLDSVFDFNTVLQPGYCEVKKIKNFDLYLSIKRENPYFVLLYIFSKETCKDGERLFEIEIRIWEGKRADVNWVNDIYLGKHMRAFEVRNGIECSNIIEKLTMRIFVRRWLAGLGRVLREQ